MIHLRRGSVAVASPATRPVMVLVLMIALVASILPQGVGAQSPEPEAPSSPAVELAPAADETPEPTATPEGPAPQPDGAQQAGTTPFPFRWVSPTRNVPSTNNLTAGGTKTIRFSLGGNRGLGILAEGFPKSQYYDCRTGRLIPGSQFHTRPLGRTGLRYDAASRLYSYDWKTQEGWSNRCRVFQLRLRDGTTHRARFRILTYRSLPPTRPSGTNLVVAGTTVNVRFHMGASAGRDIFRDSQQPRSARIDCTTQERLGSWIRTSPHGLAGLTFYRRTHDYKYAWRTSASWTGTCRLFAMRLKDGTVEAYRYRFGRAPIARNDDGTGFETDQDTAFTTGDVLANDSDPDGDPISVTALNTSGTEGTVTNNGDGTFDYDPDGQLDSLGSGEQGTDTFRYTISDGLGGTDQATVTITITGLNDAPTIADQTRSVSEAAGNGDPVGAPLTFGDPDTTDTHTFAITAGNTGGAFAIDDSRPDHRRRRGRARLRGDPQLHPHRRGDRRRHACARRLGDHHRERDGRQ